jgi:hypothetical protein
MNMNKLKTSNWLGQALLVVMLLLTQQQMIQHTVSHIQAPVQQQHDKDSDNSKNCHDCSVLAQYGSALSPSFTHLHLNYSYSLPISFTAVAIQTADLLAFNSRAPPRV